MVAVRKNITLDPVVLERFSEIAGKKGIKISAWINAKMVEFIEKEEVKSAKRNETNSYF